eukprot:EG_transcript_12823
MARDQEYMRNYSLDRMNDVILAGLQASSLPLSDAPGTLFKAVWTGGARSWDWAVLQGTLNTGCQPIQRPTLQEAKAALHGKWLHIAGDSTSRQLFNSLVSWLAPQANYRAVRKNDACYLAFSRVRAILQKEQPPNHTALEENHLWMCQCRRGLLFWDTHRDGYFTKARDGFDFRITYSYKELMFEPTDPAAVEGFWPEVKAGRATGGNLFEAFRSRLPDIWIGNAGAHAFHLRPGMGLSAPDDQTATDYGRNITRYATLLQRRFRERQPKACILWKANNVPPPAACPPQHFLHLNKVTTPAMLQYGLHVIDPEDLSRFNRMRPISCDIHLTGVPQQNIAWLTVTALVHACKDTT